MKKYIFILSLVLASCTPRLMIEATFPENATPQEKNVSLNIVQQRLRALYPGASTQTDSTGNIVLSIPMNNDSTSYRFLIAHKGQMRIFETYKNGELDESMQKMEETYIDTDSTATVQDTSAEKFSQFLKNKETSRATVGDSQPLLGRSEVLIRNRQAGAILGMCRPNDTAYVNKMLHYGIQSGILPKDISFKWGLPDYNKVIPLYGIKLPVNYAPVRNDMVQDSKIDVSGYGSYEINFSFKKEYYDFWERMTRNNIGKCLAMCVDDVVYFGPIVNGTIKSGETIITGAFSREEALVISTMIKFGEIPIVMTIKDKKVQR